MDKCTHEVRKQRWKNIINQCLQRPEGMTVKQWLDENNICEQTYYHWLKRIRQETYELATTSANTAYLQRRAEVLKELENIKLDFCPDYQDDARVEDELQNYVDNNDIKNMIEMDNISAQRRFRYYDILDNLDVNDQLLFTSFLLPYGIERWVKAERSY